MVETGEGDAIHDDLTLISALLGRASIYSSRGQTVKALAGLEKSLIVADDSVRSNLKKLMQKAGHQEAPKTGWYDLPTKAALQNCVADANCRP
ncbi:hypothetical protein HW561_16835 [Rhodobacteraceae bacterium B1Z28]|uniref:Uncharacterized protein n=1 Tax=Ruegeria haliotis TaxID=2747601 RepID=A0ABX2PUJ0_9RHOB|nr:hypothetical protein [Ruegeria haliotis]NVO57464.1 hypothetical protein [Ruegeria haliotis]